MNNGLDLVLNFPSIYPSSVLTCEEKGVFDRISKHGTEPGIKPSTSICTSECGLVETKL
jgi:hypothetical protein